MRQLALARRAAILLLAALQLSWTSVAAVMDGAREDARSPAPHVEDLGATHAGRAHPHDCIACRAVRTEYQAPRTGVELPAGRPTVTDHASVSEPTSDPRGVSHPARAPPTNLG